MYSAKYNYIYEAQKTEIVSYYKEHEVSGGTTHLYNYLGKRYCFLIN